MRQHILRILIVVILLTGIGFLIFGIAGKETKFNLSDSIQENFKANEIFNEMNLAKSENSIDIKFNQNVEVFNVLKENFDHFGGLLLSVELNESEKKRIKNYFDDYKEKFNVLKSSFEMVKAYQKETNPDESQMNQRIEKLNSDFNAFNKNFYDLTYFLEKTYKNRFLEDGLYDISSSLYSIKGILANANLQTQKNFSLVISFDGKVDALEANEFRYNENAIQIAIKFNEKNYDFWIDSFEQYFYNEATNDDLTTLLSLISSEVYYE